MVTSIACVEDMSEIVWQCFSSVCVQKLQIAFQSVKKMFVGLVTAAVLYHLQLISLHFFNPLPVRVLSLLFLISHPSFACLDLIPVLSRHFKMHIWILYFFQLISTFFSSTPFQFTAQKKSVANVDFPLFFLHVVVPPYSYLLALSSFLPSYHLSLNVCVPKSWCPEAAFWLPCLLTIFQTSVLVWCAPSFSPDLLFPFVSSNQFFFSFFFSLYLSIRNYCIHINQFNYPSKT